MNMNQKNDECESCNTNCDTPDLLEVKGVKKLVRHRYFQPAFQIATMVFFIAIIIAGLTGGQYTRFSREDDFATVIVWDVWHPLLAFSILFVGRLWCFACPLGAISEWTRRRFSLNRRYPDKFRNLWIAIILFIVISAATKHLFRFERNPLATALLLLFFIGLSIAISLVYEKRTFCRFICPTGLILGVFSLISGTELRVKSKKVCSDHSEKECLTGNENGHGCSMYEFPQTLKCNSFCIFCTECIKTCSKDNIRISTRKFGADILKLRKPHLDEAFFIHSIIVILLFKIGMERAPFRYRIIDFVNLVGLDRNLMALLIFTGLSIAAILLMYLINRSVHSRETTSHLKDYVMYTYALIPLGLGIYLIDNTFKAIRGVFYLISQASHPFGMELFQFNQPAIPYEAINFFQILLLLAGFVASLHFGFSMGEKNGERVAFSNILPLVVVALIYALIALRILTLDILSY